VLVKNERPKCDLQNSILIHDGIIGDGSARCTRTIQSTERKKSMTKLNRITMITGAVLVAALPFCDGSHAA
jgi:hypothetical protein